jgi:hypothetical protein
MKTIWIAASAASLLCTAAMAQPAPATPATPATGSDHAVPPVKAAATVMAPTTPSYTPVSAFTSVPPGEQMTSQVLGLHVRDSANKEMGQIKDIAYGPQGVQSYIVGVGGFLDMGEHYVAVQPAAIKIAYDAVGKTWSATLDATADQLKAAPAFTYAP